MILLKRQYLKQTSLICSYQFKIVYKLQCEHVNCHINKKGKNKKQTIKTYGHFALQV